MVIQGMSGFAKVLGDDLNPKLISNLVADKTSGLTACYSVLAALYAREKSGGQGQRIEIPMIDAFAAFVHSDGFAPHTYGPVPRNPVLEKVIYRAWKASDGHVALLFVEDKQFQALCRVLKREDLIDDPRYTSLAGRIANGGELFAALGREVEKYTTAELVARAHHFGAPLGPVYDVSGYMADAQVEANGLVFELEDPVHGTMKLFGSPPRYEKTPTSVRRAPPHLGAHTEEVLREVGIDPTEPDAAN
jgi:crotonobetainyl-CoA:carnitine CoA-transferase CaiB-like acyl-CoA transferase